MNWDRNWRNGGVYRQRIQKTEKKKREITTYLDLQQWISWCEDEMARQNGALTEYLRIVVQSNRSKAKSKHMNKQQPLICCQKGSIVKRALWPPPFSQAIVLYIHTVYKILRKMRSYDTNESVPPQTWGQKWRLGVFSLTCCEISLVWFFLI